MPRRRRAVLAAVLAALLSSACVGDGDLRRQQAEELRRLCQLIAARNDAPPERVRAIGDRPLRDFMPTGDGIDLHATDLIVRGCT